MGLIWLALAAIAVWALVRLGRQTERRGRAHWRVTATLLGSVLLAGGALAAFRGAWLAAAALAGAGLYLAWSSRIRSVVRSEPISEADARAVLGVPAGANEAEIRGGVETGHGPRPSRSGRHRGAGDARQRRA